MEKTLIKYFKLATTYEALDPTFNLENFTETFIKNNKNKLNMEKKLFIKSIEAIKKQYEYDNKIAIQFSKIFPNAFAANLLPNNYLINNALIEILQIENNDLELCTTGQSWIEYFCFELNFGAKYKSGMVTKNGKNIDLSNSGMLWELLNKN